MGEATDEVRSAETLKGSTIEIPVGGSVRIGPEIHNQAEVHGQSSVHNPDDIGGSGQEATEIRSDIEKTRASLSDTIDALQDKLDPTRIAEQVKDQIREKATEAYDTAKIAVKEATIGKAGKIVSNVTEAVSDMTGRAGTAVSDTSTSIVHYIRENPVPFALVGIGLGMLAFSKRQGKSSYGSQTKYDPIDYGRQSYVGTTESTTEPSLTDRARDVASGVADSARGAATSVADTARGAATSVADTARVAADRTTTAVTSAAGTVRDAAGTAVDITRRQFHDLSDQARQGARVATDTLKTTLQENPMVLGVAALAVGAVVGISLPSTRIEGEYMGEAREKLMGQAKSVAQDAAQKVQRVTEEAGRTLKDAAQKEGLVSPESGEQKA